MTKDRMKAFCTGLFLCFAAAGLTACGSSDDESTDGAVIGRLTSASDTQIVVEIFEEKEGGRPDIASGSGAGVDRQRPEGEQSLDGKEPSGNKPKGTPPADAGQPRDSSEDAQKPQGSPPADDQKGKGRGGRTGETKTYYINSDTVIYKMSGEEKTEISIDEVELGSMLSIVAAEDTATCITVQDSSDFKDRGHGGRGETAGEKDSKQEDSQ